jgi:hypothetical protein
MEEDTGVLVQPFNEVTVTVYVWPGVPVIVVAFATGNPPSAGFADHA